MEQVNLKVGRCFALISNQLGDLICLLLSAAFFLLSGRSLSFNNAMITLTSARLSARIVELASDDRITLVLNTRYIDAKEPIRAKLLFLSPIRSRKGAYQLKTTLAIDSDIKR